MPEPTLEQIAPNGVVQLNNTPGGLDETFDSLFPAEPTSVVIQPVQQATAQPVQQTPPTTTNPPQTTQQPEFFLKGDKSVYKSAEDATRGINEKDAIIEQLRQRYALTTGIDPITGKPVASNGQPQPNQIDYDQQPGQYLEDLYTAAKSGGPEAYKNVQQKFLFDTLKPLQPILQKAARDQAAETLAVEIPAAKGFVGSPIFVKALDANPELKQAVAISESNYQFHSRLPGLFKLVYQVAQGLQLPELLKAQATTQTPSQTQATPPRTTVQPTTASPATSTARPTFKTIEGIRATIAEMEGRGVKLDF